MADARKQAAHATLDAAKAEVERANKQADVDEEAYEKYTNAQDIFNTYVGSEGDLKLVDYKALLNTIAKNKTGIDSFDSLGEGL